jgi:hypothetical protein
MELLEYLASNVAGINIISSLHSGLQSLRHREYRVATEEGQ